MLPDPDKNYFVFWGIIHAGYEMCEIVALRDKYSRRFSKIDLKNLGRGVA